MPSLDHREIIEIVLVKQLKGVSDGEDLYTVMGCPVDDTVAVMDYLTELRPFEFRDLAAAERELAEPPTASKIPTTSFSAAVGRSAAIHVAISATRSTASGDQVTITFGAV